MERTLVSPWGVAVRLEAGMQHNVETATRLSVHFRCVTMDPAPAAAPGNDYNFYFGTPFSSILHESRWEREREVRRMMTHVAGSLVHPHDLHFLISAFCDYSQDALQSFYQRGGSSDDLLSIYVSVHIPHAVVESQLQFHPPDIAIDPFNLPNATIAEGPYNPPLLPHPPHAGVGLSEEPSLQQPHLTDIAIDPYHLWVQVFLAAAAATAITADGPYNPPPQPHDEPSQPQPHLPDIAIDLRDPLMQVPFPDFIWLPLNWVGQGVAEHFGNNPPSASVVQQLERVVFGEAANGRCRETSCAICIDDFEATSVLSVMPCGHSFHSACLDEWLVRSNLCPLCRFSLPAVN
ncbi:hypothetical protein ZIOFF_031193 [Zingiber officinale]|uniref:RING-type domain-containing protein n=1 Tax=Zingiber officinale TaxID=94328 RepID=A0A8J5L4P4_ZINOF|nr:hypothetical protein ZIOFF_031193 [Zingiber officinale]